MTLVRSWCAHAGLALALLAGVGSVQARSDVQWSVGIGVPGVVVGVNSPQAYYAPPPVYYAPPAYRPPPVYYAPPPTGHRRCITHRRRRCTTGHRRRRRTTRRRARITITGMATGAGKGGATGVECAPAWF